MRFSFHGILLPIRVRALLLAPALFVTVCLPARAQIERPPSIPSPPRIKPPTFHFPPNPPPLGAVIIDPPGTAADPERTHPLGPFVSELFYPPLSSAVFATDDLYRLSRRDEKRLEEFREQRAALLALVRAQLPALATLPPAERRAAWEALARDHAPQLTALETRAEQLRERLAERANWNEFRSWRLGRGKLDRPRDELQKPEYFVLRAATYYQEGLSPAQRRLLRERSLRLEGAAFDRKLSPPPEGALVWFSPDTTQIFLPPDTPREIAAGFLDYTAHKTALQAGIQDEIYAHDADLFEGTRRRALAALARSHAPRIDALEKEAEALRAALAAWGGFPRRQFVAAWPDDLRALVDQYEEKSAALDRMIAQALAALMAEYPPAPEYQGRLGHEKREQWKQERRAYEASERRRLEEEEFSDARHELAALLDHIREAITREFGAEAVQEHAEPDGFLRTLQRVFRRGEAYYEYDLAVLEPGLSPELRRLLLSGALEKLELPLPDSEQRVSRLTEILGI